MTLGRANFPQMNLLSVATSNQNLTISQVFNEVSLDVPVPDVK